jgi:hypothetical protein
VVVETAEGEGEKKVKEEGDGGSKPSLGMMGLVELWKRAWPPFLWAAKAGGRLATCMGHGAWLGLWSVGRELWARWAVVRNAWGSR